MNKILWIDTETGGFSADKNGIIELGLIVDIDGEIKEKIRYTMKPTGRTANSKALEVNGFTREQIQAFTPWENVYYDFIYHLQNITKKYYPEKQFSFGGQNVPFDNRFICSWARVIKGGLPEWEKLTNQDKYSFIDTKEIAKDLQRSGKAPGLESMSLGNLCKYFNVSLENSHTALGDIEATRSLYYVMEAI